MDSRVIILGNKDSYINHILYELRDEDIQKDRMRFRVNLEKIGELIAYELSKELKYETREVITQLGTLEMNTLVEQPVLVSILRAGVPFHQGFLRFFDHADNGFISAYRHHTKGNEFIVKVEYTAVPDVTNRTLIMIDPMIATGKSVVLSYREIVEEVGQPESLFICCALASEEGVEYVLRNIPRAKLYMVAIDHELTARSYIVPGLGDAGDLAYGPK